MLFAQWHITDMEISHSDGVTQVKHAELGWMSHEQYYRLQKIHDILPMIEKVIEGGYRAKAALWGLEASVSVAGFSADIPLGLMFPVIGIIALNDAIAAKNPGNIALWSYALVGPWGDILTALAIYAGITGIIGDAEKATGDYFGAVWKAVHDFFSPPGSTMGEAGGGGGAG